MSNCLSMGGGFEGRGINVTVWWGSCLEGHAGGGQGGAGWCGSRICWVFLPPGKAGVQAAHRGWKCT